MSVMDILEFTDINGPPPKVEILRNKAKQDLEGPQPLKDYGRLQGVPEGTQKNYVNI